jgi:hypothetical protein
MRALVSGWTGRRLNDANFTASGEKYAQQIIDLFDRNNTLSEFNSGTYTGVSLFGLVLWSKYLPKDSVMAENGPRMLRDTWHAVSQLWHPGLKNMAGPWDRSYGYDMNRYLSLMALWFWAFIGKEKSSLIAYVSVRFPISSVAKDLCDKPQAMSHFADYAWAPLFAVLAKYHQSLLSPGLISNLSHFTGEHTFTASTYYPPIDNVPRNITSWLSENLTIGAESFDENGLGGPSQNQQTFNPAVIQWNTGDEVSWISLYPTETALQVNVSSGRLGLTYPKGNSSSTFTFVVGTFKRNTTIADWSGVQGLTVNVSGNVDPGYNLSYAGNLGGVWQPINDFEYWNFTYSMPKGFDGVPSVIVDVELT